MPRPIHFEFSAADTTRAIDFYSSVFGWRFQEWQGPAPYWLIATGEGPGIDGGLTSRTGPNEGTVNTIDVPSCADFAAKVQAAGGSIVAGPMPIPGVGWLAYCTDTEGTRFGIMQNDPTAGG